jgi:hypothetical protein
MANPEKKENGAVNMEKKFIVKKDNPVRVKTPINKITNINDSIKLSVSIGHRKSKPNNSNGNVVNLNTSIEDLKSTYSKYKDSFRDILTNYNYVD